MRPCRKKWLKLMLLCTFSSCFCDVFSRNLGNSLPITSPPWVEVPTVPPQLNWPSCHHCFPYAHCQMKQACRFIVIIHGWVFINWKFLNPPLIISHLPHGFEEETTMTGSEPQPKLRPGAFVSVPTLGAHARWESPHGRLGKSSIWYHRKILFNSK